MNEERFRGGHEIYRTIFWSLAWSSYIKKNPDNKKAIRRSAIAGQRLQKLHQAEYDNPMGQDWPCGKEDCGCG